MEENLDQVGVNKATPWDLLTQFYQPFRKDLEAAAIKMVSIKGVGVPTNSPPGSVERPCTSDRQERPFPGLQRISQMQILSDYTATKGHIGPWPRAGETTDKVCEKCGQPCPEARPLRRFSSLQRISRMQEHPIAFHQRLRPEYRR